MGHFTLLRYIVTILALRSNPYPPPPLQMTMQILNPLVERMLSVIIYFPIYFFTLIPLHNAVLFIVLIDTFTRIFSIFTCILEK